MLNPSVKLHNDTLAVVKTWIDGLPQDRKQKILSGLTRDGVRQGLHHDSETEKQGQQLFAKYNPQPTLPQLNSSYYRPGAVTDGLSASGTAINSTTTSLGVGNYTSPSGYSTSTYQTYTSSQRGISSGTNASSGAGMGVTTTTGTAYAQGMTMDPASSKAVEYRMWPYNMDYYTQKDDYSLKFLSPYYHGMPSFLQAASGFKLGGQSTYLQGNTTTSSGVSPMGLSSGSGTSLLGTGSGIMTSGVQSGTNLGGLSTGTSGLFTTATGLVPQQSSGTIGVQSPLNLMSSSTTGITTRPSTVFNSSGPPTPLTTPGLYTTQLNSSVPPHSGTGTSLPITTTSSIISPAVPDHAPLGLGQGSNSSFYGQVNDHGHSSPVSPTMSSSTLQSMSPVNQVSSAQNSMQNMNLNV